MGIIRVREQGNGGAVVSFDHGEEYPVTVVDPFAEEEEARLEWYFEQRLRFPFTDDVRASWPTCSSTTESRWRCSTPVSRDNRSATPRPASAPAALYA